MLGSGHETNQDIFSFSSIHSCGWITCGNNNAIYFPRSGDVIHPQLWIWVWVRDYLWASWGEVFKKMIARLNDQEGCDVGRLSPRQLPADFALSKSLQCEWSYLTCHALLWRHLKFIPCRPFSKISTQHCWKETCQIILFLTNLAWESITLLKHKHDHHTAPQVIVEAIEGCEEFSLYQDAISKAPEEYGGGG